MNVFKNKTTRFLTTSLIAVVLLCVCVFSFLTVHMNYESTQTINQVGTLYMSNRSPCTSPPPSLCGWTNWTP